MPDEVHELQELDPATVQSLFENYQNSVEAHQRVMNDMARDQVNARLAVASYELRFNGMQQQIGALQSELERLRGNYSRVKEERDRLISIVAAEVVLDNHQVVYDVMNDIEQAKKVYECKDCPE